jgi:hypothetical protein
VSLCTTATRRQRNPTVARYLSLESTEAPPQLSSSGDVSRSPIRKSQRKRRKLDDAANAAPRGSTQSSHDSNLVQPRVSESLRVTKPRHAPISSSRKSTSEPVLPDKDLHTTHFESQDEQQPYEQSHSATRNFTTERSRATLTGTVGEDTSPNEYNEHDANAQSYDLNIDDSDPNLSNHFHYQQLTCGGAVFDEEDFDDDLDDEEFLKLASDMFDIDGNIGAPSDSLFDSDPSHKVRGAQRPSSSADASLLSDEPDKASQRTAKKFVSPVTLTTRLLAVTSDVDRAEARKPIVRPPFPAAVRDRSPIIGLSSNSLLRTCFRIGEAINQAHHASKSGKHIVFELYARIFDSQRDDTKQYFTFCDLFHGKPPYIKAVYEGAIWKSVQLFDYDSKRLLQQGRICRCIGTMKREGRQWTMTVLNIWESTWEDIKWVEGIVNS